MPHRSKFGSSALAGWMVAVSLAAMGAFAVVYGSSAPPRPATDREPDRAFQSATVTPRKPAQPKKVEFVVFSAKWCAVCRDVPPVLDRLRAAFPTVTFRDLDVDEKENEKLCVEYGSDAVPYNFILVDGKVVAKYRGFLPFAIAERIVRDALKGLDGLDGLDAAGT